MTDGRRFQGQLELTWANQPLRLLADEDGSYRWMCLPATTASLRSGCWMMRTLSGTFQSPRSGTDNLFIRGDALNAHELAELPEFARQLAGKAKLCYIARKRLAPTVVSASSGRRTF